MQENFGLVWRNTSPRKEKTQCKGKAFTSSICLKKILRYSSEIRDQKVVIKLDSKTISDPRLLENFAENINILCSCGVRLIIIHDYVDLIESSLKLLGLEQAVMHDLNTLNYKNAQIVEMVLSGYLNKVIVSKLCELGSYAIGISGKDGNLIKAKKSKFLQKRNFDHSVYDLRFSSTPVVINPEILLNFEDMNIIPVISPIARDDDQNTQVLDVNMTASVISNSIGADHLVFGCKEDLIEDEGIKIYDTNIIKNLRYNNLNYPEQSLFDAACNSIENSANAVHFIDAAKPDSLINSFFPKNNFN